MAKLTRRTFIAAGSTAMAGLALGLAGCGGEDTGSEDSEDTGSDDEAKDDASDDSASTNVSGEIMAVGASALQPLVQAGADEFMKENPDVQITVEGGGSGQGITQIAEGTVDIGNSDVFAEEKDVDSKEAKIEDHKVCVVGMGPVCHPDVSVDSISKDDLKGIFMEEITNWSEVGGDDLEINVIHRAEGSGTRQTFETYALDGEETPTGGQEQDNSGSVVSIVAQTPGSISYLAFSYFDDSIKALQVDDVEPTPENVADNSWFIWAYEHMYTSETPTEQTKAFIEYMLSDEVQDNLVPELGYIPITTMTVERDMDGNVTNL